MTDTPKKLSLPAKPRSSASKKSSHKPARPNSRPPSGERSSYARRPKAPKPPMNPRPAPPVMADARLDLHSIIAAPADVLPPSGLAYQLTMAAHAAHAVVEGYSLQQALAVLPIDDVARANVQRLSFDAMRHLGLVQFWVQRAVDKPPVPWLQAMLWVALTQLHLREEDEFTLVNQAVAAVEARKPHAKGLVNAILRRFLRERDEWLAAASDDLVAHWNYPLWWIEKLQAQHPNDWRQILAVGNAHPPMTLRVNARATDVAAYQALLSEHGRAASPMPALSPNALVLELPCAVSQLPEFGAGAVSVQDAGAQLSVELLDLQNGMRVLDACAAPGGKTCHILERFDVDLLALEKDAPRSWRIEENFERLNLKADIEIMDANIVKKWWDGVPFDRILLDAPCSASGIVRRHPDIRWLRESADTEGLARQQKQLLRSMWQVLAVGGRLLYCTCSVFEDEGEAVISEFMGHTPNASRVELPQMRELTLTAGQLLPRMDENANHDGFFYAALIKTA